jgi:hypothetical protein
MLTGCGRWPCCIRTFRISTGPPVPPFFFFSSRVRSQIFNTGYRLVSSSPIPTNKPPASASAVALPLLSHARNSLVGTKCRSSRVKVCALERMTAAGRGERGEVGVMTKGGFVCCASDTSCAQSWPYSNERWWLICILGIFDRLKVKEGELTPLRCGGRSLRVSPRSSILSTVSQSR